MGDDFLAPIGQAAYNAFRQHDEVERTGMAKTSGTGAGWFKSSYSGPNFACLEVSFIGELVLIRDSKYLLDVSNDPKLQPILSATRGQWIQFVDTVRNDITTTVDLSIQAKPTADGGMTLTTADSDVVLHFTPEEVAAFVAGVKNREFDLAVTAV
jgi:hypothetical protein